LKAGDRKELKITLRKSEQAPQVLGKVDPSWAVEPIDGKPFDWAEIVASDRAVLCWVEPDREPSKHIFQDLISLRKEMDKTNCPFIFMVPPDRLPAGFTPDSWKNLPASSRFVTLPDLSSLAALERATGKSFSGQFPVVVRINKSGEITYLSSGYKIGIGEEIIKNLQGQ
jgi:hypothetical protein